MRYPTIRLRHGSFLAPTLDRWGILWFFRFGWQRAALARAARLVSGARLALDIGANMGVFSVQLARAIGPEGKLLSFEPEPKLFAALERNLTANRCHNVVPYRIACGAKRGAMAFRVGRINRGDNRLVATDGRAEKNGLQVEVRTVDSLLDGQPVDFAKIDVQGFECDVLRGMRETIARSPNLRLLIEFCPWTLARAHSSPQALFATLAELELVPQFADGPPALACDVETACARAGSGGHIDLIAARRDRHPSPR